MDAIREGRCGKVRLIFLLKESWFCMVKRKHNGQIAKEALRDIEASVWLQKSRLVSFKHRVENDVHNRGYRDRFFQHERVQSWRSSTDNCLQPAELLHAGVLSYICGSHKGESGALCSMSVG